MQVHLGKQRHQSPLPASLQVWAVEGEEHDAACTNGGRLLSLYLKENTRCTDLAIGVGFTFGQVVKQCADGRAEAKPHCDAGGPLRERIAHPPLSLKHNLWFCSQLSAPCDKDTNIFG